MSTVQATPAETHEAEAIPWWNLLFMVYLLARVVVGYFWPTFKFWSTLGPIIMTVVLAGACVTIGRWAFGKPVSRESAVMMTVLLIAVLFRLACGVN